MPHRILYNTIRLFSFITIVLLLPTSNTRTATTTKLFAMIVAIGTEIPVF